MQTNYLASCSFMDSFARCRHRLGLPATSLSLNRIGLSGAIARSLLYARSLARNGLYGNDEDQSLHCCEAALSPSVSLSENEKLPGGGWLDEAHLLAGVEPARLLTFEKEHQLQDMAWYRDALFGNIMQAVESLRASK